MKVTVHNLEKEEVIDWNKVQLVTNDDYIIMVARCQKESIDSHHFCGIDINDGDYSNRWTKDCFKPFHGSITLQND